MSPSEKSFFQTGYDKCLKLVHTFSQTEFSQIVAGGNQAESIIPYHGTTFVNDLSLKQSCSVMLLEYHSRAKKPKVWL
jgi:hypothetical protein